MAKCDLSYRIGSVYYEFSREEEEIKEDKDIILMNNRVRSLIVTIHVETVDIIVYRQKKNTLVKE